MTSWSSVVQKGIPKDYALKMMVYHSYILNDNAQCSNNLLDGPCMVYYRDIPVEYHVNGNGHYEKKGEKKFYRERKVPKKKNKNY